MSIENSVVKIISTIASLDYSAPWTTGKKGTGIGTGYCINVSRGKKKLRILTNAHVIDGAKRVVIHKSGSSARYTAEVESVIYECDLAILTLSKENKPDVIKRFWDNTPPLEIGPVPPKSSKVRCYGYPLGGENISVTKGVISRVEILPYMDISKGIAIQIDAAINPGNSGGPAIGSDGRVVGTVFSGIDGEGIQNMGYIIPTFLTRYFLRYLEKYGRFAGLSHLGISVQNMENESLRKFAQLNPTQTGVLVSGVDEGSSADGALRAGDIITKINGRDVDYDGAIRLVDIIRDFNESTYVRDPVDVSADEAFTSLDEIVHYSSMIGLKIPGETVKISILRRGKDKIVNVTLKTREFLVPMSPYGVDPLYYIVGGYVFIPLTRMYILEKLRSGADVDHLIGTYGGSSPREKGEQVIVLSEILSTGLAHGYDSDNNVLHAVNGKQIKNIYHLRKVIDELLRSATANAYLIFEFRDSSDIHVLNMQDVKKYNKKIVEENIGKIPLTNVPSVPSVPSS